MLTPRKSVTAIIGLIPKTQDVEPLYKAIFVPLKKLFYFCFHTLFFVFFYYETSKIKKMAE